MRPLKSPLGDLGVGNQTEDDETTVAFADFNNKIHS